MLPSTPAVQRSEAAERLPRRPNSKQLRSQAGLLDADAGTHVLRWIPFSGTPLDAAGLAWFSASINASRFSRNASGANEARPMVALHRCHSCRCGTALACHLAFFTAPATSADTVPTFGLGIRRADENLAKLTNQNASRRGWQSARRSSGPTLDGLGQIVQNRTISAPAALASSAFAPCANTATRTTLPGPWAAQPSHAPTGLTSSRPNAGD